MSGLKTCPICNTDVFTEVVSVSEKQIILRIRCNNSECGVTKQTVHKLSSVCSPTFNDVIEAIALAEESWNNRAR